MRGTLSFVVAAGMLIAGGMPATAFHTPFAYRVDRFEADGNRLGAADGVPDFVDQFADGSLSPNWYTAYGTATESGGYLVLQNPGVHFPSPDGSALDLSIAGSSSPTWVYDGMGDFTATAYWEAVVPPVGHHYHFSLYTFGGGGGIFSETFGLAIRQTDTTVDIEQHLTEIDQFGGIFQNTQMLFHQIDPADVTGHLVFQIHFTDATNTVTTAFSLDDGVTWQSPFPSATIFVGRTTAQFLLSADPFGNSVATTTTVPGPTTTTTTLPPGACVPGGCRRSTIPGRSKLVLGDRSSDVLTWKWNKGEATGHLDWGPFLHVQNRAQSFCLGDANGVPLLQIEIPANSVCADGAFDCWRLTGAGDLSFLYKDPQAERGGLRKVLLRTGDEGKAGIILKARGENLVLPNLPLALPITARWTNEAGDCWADTFDAARVIRNTTTEFAGLGGSPSGAFVDR